MVVRWSNSAHIAHWLFLVFFKIIWIFVTARPLKCNYRLMIKGLFHSICLKVHANGVFFWDFRISWTLKKADVESSTTRNQNKRMRVLKTAELEMKAIFIGWKLVTTTFLLFDIRTAVGPLEVYLQNLKSLRNLRNLPAFEAEGFEAFEICPFSRDAQKNTFLMSARSQKNRRGRKMNQRNTP